MKLHLSGLLALTLLLSAPLNLVHAQDAATQLKGPKNATNQYSGTVYGPIDSQDTLWRIASRYRQNPELTVYQVMVAIYELNPDAFEQNNLNLLVDGAMLKLPSERYVARIDAEKAQQRAEADEQAWARMANQPGASLNNLKPPVPLVNQDDLTNTKSAIEDKITRLDSEQTRQFEELRNQFAASLNNVQALLDENRKLYDRVEQVNDDLKNLRGQVEGDVQSQMDEQLSLQKQLLAMMEQEQARQQAKENESIMKVLLKPINLMIGSTVLVLLLVGGIIAWALRRPKPAAETVAAPAPVSAPVQAAVPEPKLDEMDDLATALADDFDDTAELSDDDLFNDDDLLDDVLSSELEDALDDELENFAELDDDMLVPDGDDFESGSSELDQDDLDSLFNEDDMSGMSLDADGSDDFGGIDLAGDDDSLGDAFDNVDDVPDGAQEPSEDDFDVSVTDNAIDIEDSEPDDLPDAPVAQELPVVDDTPDKPEISIDELFDEEDEATLSSTLGVDDDTVNDEMLEKLDKEINDQNQALDRLTDNIINEIEQLEMMGMMDIEEDEEDDIDDDVSKSSKPSPQAIQDLDALSDELDEIDVEDMENADEFTDPLSDELIADLQAQDEDLEPEEIVEPVVESSDELDEDLLPETEESDDLSDELLAELTAEDATKDREMDSLSDELLSELEAESEEVDEPVEPEPEPESVPETDSEDDSDFEDDLTRELLAELGVEEDETSAQEDQQEETLQEEASGIDSLDDIEDDLLPDIDETADDELLPDVEPDSELDEPADTDEVESTDPLEAALDDFDKQLMDDIPSFGEFSESTKSEDFDDSILDEAFGEVDDFELEQEQDGVVPERPARESEINELEDVPGLDDWLTDHSGKEDSDILEEIENSDFDDLLTAIDEDTAPETSPKNDLGNPDLDLDALLNDVEPETISQPESDDEGDFLDVETLMDDSLDGDEDSFDEKPLDLEVSLSDFTGVTDDDDVIDIDKDAGQGANLDLARMYIEMDDNESAKELLQEVAENGSEEQRNEALALLKNLAD